MVRLVWGIPAASLMLCLQNHVTLLLTSSAPASCSSCMGEIIGSLKSDLWKPNELQMHADDPLLFSPLV